MVAEPSNATTMAVDVAAPAEEVWRWLVQIGADRGGWYSYDGLENLVRLDIHTTDEVREQWQDLAVGDVVVMVPRGWPRIPGLPGLSKPLGIPVAVVDPPSTLVLREDPAEMPWDAVWSFHVVGTGPDRCRLVSHSRAHAEPGAAGTFARAAGLPMDLVTAAMTWRMLRGIRDRAERAVGSSRS